MTTNFTTCLTYGLTGSINQPGYTIDNDGNLVQPPSWSPLHENWGIHRNNTVSTFSVDQDWMGSDGIIRAKASGTFRVGLSLDLSQLGSYNGSIYAFLQYKAVNGSANTMHNRNLSVINYGGGYSQGGYSNVESVYLNLGDSLQPIFVFGNSLALNLNNTVLSNCVLTVEGNNIFNPQSLDGSA